jgi:vacuolar-type H+-ATPase subunit I/STV1
MENIGLNEKIFVIIFFFWLYALITNIKDKDILNFLKNNYLVISNFINKKKNLFHQYKNKDNDMLTIKEQEEIQTQENQPREEQNKEMLKYENKYLKEIRKMTKEYILNDDEIEIKKIKYTEFYNKIIEQYVNLINVNIKQILDLNEETENMENTDKKIYIGEDGEEYLVDSDGEEYSFKTKKEYKLEIENLQKNIDKLNNEKNNIIEIQKKAEELSQNYIIEQRLDKLKNCFVIEKTPLGNVLMIYRDSTFEYYSDNAIPYRYLETVARKYVKFFNCKQIYIDMEEELKIYEEKINKEAEVNENNLKINNTKKNVFAKFKSYNKDALTGKVNMVPPPKNNISNNIIPNESNNEKVILKENSNHYKYQGKLSNFNILKKIDRKVVDKKYGMSFSDFKKTIMYKKIKN